MEKIKALEGCSHKEALDKVNRRIPNFDISQTHMPSLPSTSIRRPSEAPNLTRIGHENSLSFSQVVQVQQSSSQRANLNSPTTREIATQTEKTSDRVEDKEDQYAELSKILIKCLTLVFNSNIGNRSTETRSKIINQLVQECFDQKKTDSDGNPQNTTVIEPKNTDQPESQAHNSRRNHKDDEKYPRTKRGLSNESQGSDTDHQGTNKPKEPQTKKPNKSKKNKRQ